MKSRVASQLRVLSRALQGPSSRRWARCSSTTQTSVTSSTPSYSTPLAKQIAEAIKTTGPITLAAYMRQCLTSPDGGYYTTSKGESRDPFGARGDFITSPEISQMFGEMLGVWIVTEWMSQGKKGGVQLIELGPGRGTLMDDVLRTIKSFRQLSTSIDTVYLVEASSALREAQKNLLCGPSADFEEIENGHRCISKYASIPITWYEDFRFVPKDSRKSPYILAHEFFDALPIHTFENTTSGWRELMVSHNPRESTHKSLSTPRSQLYSKVPEFSLTMAKAPTPHSIMLPEISERYKALKKLVGSIIEISPDSLATVEALSQRIGSARSGAALFIDYGPANTVPVNSLRGIRSHRTVSPFTSPGEVDISADVDFMGLAERALEASENVEVHGPVEQGVFLLMMGMKERLEALLSGMKGKEGEDADEDAEVEKKKRLLESGFRRLVERSGGAMGKVYKVMAIIPENDGKRKPVGFGGAVEA
ncbi:hypothetical protein RUND412_008525 [Rhizina undulata]